MKIISVVGARPQFIKASPISRVLRVRHEEILIHTGQHYDYDMSEIFFEELGIPEPQYNLSIGSASHGRQTGLMLEAIEQVLLKEHPDCVLVYGDTNSTLAGALAAAKLHIPVVHIEAGLRSFNRIMPEEINRVLTDHCSRLLFCPTQVAVDNLHQEGIKQNVFLVGDVMYDALLAFLPRVVESEVLEEFGLEAECYVLATVHRASNTEDLEHLQQLLACLALIELPVIFPMHPRTAAAIQVHGLHFPPTIQIVKPVSYLQMLALEHNAHTILTDSGGVQKEAFLLGIPCITLRTETEWVETVATGWNTLIDLDPLKLAEALARPRPSGTPPPVYGDGNAAQRIAGILEQTLQ